MNIRKAIQSDFSRIHELMCQLHNLHVRNRPDIFNDADPCHKNYFEGLLDNTNAIVLVAENNKKIIGYCDISIKTSSSNPLLKTRIIAYMEDLFVDKSSRRFGIGKLLFKKAEEIAKEKGADTIELMVWGFNDSAIDFYREMGLTPQSYIMEKKLSS